MGACGFERDLVYSRSSLFIFFYLYPTNMESNFLRRSWLFWEGAIILGCCGARKSAGNPLPPPTLCDMSVCMCPYMHDQYPLSTFPLVPSGGVDSDQHLPLRCLRIVRAHAVISHNYHDDFFFLLCSLFSINPD